MHRFYCPNADFSPHKIKITNPGEIYHLNTVLRMVKGDKLEIFNGKGEEIEGWIEEISKIEVEVLVVERRRDPNPQRTRVVLACAIPKKSKFEFIVEKSTELGVDEIIPMRTSRTEVIWIGERQERKGARYEGVAVNAAKQSARLTVPVIHPQKEFKDVIASFGPESLCLIPCLTGQRKPLKEVLQAIQGQRQIVFLIGPEGDFTSQEVDSAIKAGFIPVSLGETTLKVDTAAIIAVGFTRMIL